MKQKNINEKENHPYILLDILLCPLYIQEALSRQGHGCKGWNDSLILVFVCILPCDEVKKERGGIFQMDHNFLPSSKEE